MKKSKLFKTISFSSLALLMGIAGTMAFAPLGSSPSVAGASEMVDQINTKADGENIKYAPSALGLDPENDPVIYTTESGLEIKFGGGGLPSGALAGYPYFTMGTYNNYAVNWVIIGLPASGELFHMPYTTFRNDLFFEYKTPAGKAIADCNGGPIILAAFSNSSSNLVCNEEIPEGCVLAYSEYCLGSTTFGSSANYAVSNVKTYMENLYSSGLGLSAAQQSWLQPQTLNARWASTSSSIANQYLFSLTGPYSNFKSSTYITSDALRVAYNIGTTSPVVYWLRDGATDVNNAAFFVKTNGGISGNYSDGSYTTYTKYVRPACVIKLV